MTSQPQGAAPAATDSRNHLAADLRLLVRTAWYLDRSRVIVQAVALVLSGLLGGVGLFLLVPIVSSITGPSVDLPVIGSIGLESAPLWALLAGFVALTALQALVTRTAAVNSTRLQQHLVDRLRHDAFAAVLAAKWSFVMQMRRSDVIHVITGGAGRAGIAVSLLITGSVALVLAISTTVVALCVAPGVALLALAAIIVLSVVQGVGIRPAHRLGRRLSEQGRHLEGVVVDSLDSLRLVRAHDASGVWVDRLADAFTSTRNVQLANVERMSTVSAITSVTTAVAAASMVLVATWADVEPASIVVMVLLLARLASQAQSVVRTATLLANALPAVSDVTELTRAARLAVEYMPDAPPARVPDPGFDTARRRVDGPDVPLLELRDVTFRYDSSGGGVEHLSFRIEHGGVVALAGRSGAGKSTTADIVLGLLQPQSGEVLVHGRSLGATELPLWRRHVAYVPQETVLLPGTLRDNLVWSAGRGVTDDECWEALGRAAAGFASALPDGLDTVLGERGIRLSGGERQRVAIARALLRRPSLLVLDEATSSLDDETEAEVLATVASLAPSIAVLVIAHRRSTLDVADHVIRLEQGRQV